MLKPEITRGTALPITLDYIKAQAVIDFDCDDGLLSEDIIAAVDYIEGNSGIMGRAILDQTVVQKLDGFGCLELPYGDVTSITSVEYYDAGNALQVVPATSYALMNGVTDYIHFFNASDIPAVYDRPDAVAVTYQAGWGAAALVPGPIKKALAMIITSWYENRTGTSAGRNDMQSIPFGATALLAPYRRVGV